MAMTALKANRLRAALTLIGNVVGVFSIISVMTATGVLRNSMVEAIILCEICGVIGVMFGIIGGNVVGKMLEVPAIIPWDWVAIGLGVCSLVGFTFGVYPAWKASTLDPIEALRYE